MVDFDRDLTQGGLPRLVSSKRNVWLVEIEAFPPTYKVFISGDKIANEVYKDFLANKTLKELLRTYTDLAARLDSVPEDFFVVPVNLISICSVLNDEKAKYKKHLEALISVSVNSVPDLSLRWPASYNLKRQELSFQIGKVGIYSGTSKYYVAELEDIQNAHERNLKVLAVSKR